MKKTASNQNLRAIVVGRGEDRFVRYIAAMLESYGVDYSCCEDIYLAVVELAEITGSVVVFGRFSHLSREGGVFLKKMKGRGFFCCCLADKKPIKQQFHFAPIEQRYLLIVNEAVEMERILKRLLTATEAKNEINNSSSFMTDESVMTKAELDALLEV